MTVSQTTSSRPTVCRVDIRYGVHASCLSRQTLRCSNGGTQAHDALYAPNDAVVRNFRGSSGSTRFISAEVRQESPAESRDFRT